MNGKVTRVIYEYATLRYVADIEREEFINVGLIMMSKRYGWMKSELYIDQTRISTCFPKADIGLLERQLGVFVNPGVPSADLPVEERYRWLAAVKSAIIQTSPSHPGILLAEGELGKAEIRCLLDAKFQSLLARLVKTRFPNIC